MPAPEDRPESAANPDETPDELMSPKPDEDGPHDVPDDMVIEKTLPSHPRQQ